MEYGEEWCEELFIQKLIAFCCRVLFPPSGSVPLLPFSWVIDAPM